MHQLVDADIAGLRGVMTSLRQTSDSLELDIQGLTATLIEMKNRHKEVSHYNDPVYIVGTMRKWKCLRASPQHN